MATITASSTSQTDVQSAIDSASSGDTVSVPSGSSTWTSAVTCAKNIYIEGAGLSNTLITLDSAIGSYVGGIQLSGSGYWEMSGISFTGDVYLMVISGYPTSFRVHHCAFEGQKSRVNWAYGLIDHNTFKNCSEAIDVRWGHPYDDTYAGVDPLDGAGSYSWSLPIDLGGSNKLFIEDNEFDFTDSGAAWHAITGSNGARWVFRHNTMTCTSGSSVNMDVHGNFFNDRSTFSFEFYENTLVSARPYLYQAINVRGGSGVIYNNEFTEIDSGDIRSHIDLQNYRCWCESSGVWEYDDIVDMTYPAPDQINNLYIWDNTENGVAISPTVYTDIVYTVNRDADFIQEDRDYFTEEPSGYTAYTYPHPLQNAEEPTSEIYIMFTV